MTDPAERQTLSIVVPVYYNEESLPILSSELKTLEAELDHRGLNTELILVDDGSGDGSFEQLMEMKRDRPQTKIVKLTRNFGSVAAAKCGFGFVTGNCFCILAADLQDPPNKILEMAEHWLKGQRFVICVRESRSDPLLTRLFAAIYYKAITFLVSRDYPSGGFDLMLLDESFLPHMVEAGKNTHPNLYAYWLGVQPTVLTYHRGKRRHGKSRWTFAKKLKLFVDTITGFSVVPIRLISGFGLGAALLSFLYGAYIFVNGLLGRIDVPGYTTLIVLTTFFSGLILVMLGIIGEYLWRVFDATQNKPESVIEETYL